MLPLNIILPAFSDCFLLLIVENTYEFNLNES